MKVCYKGTIAVMALLMMAVLFSNKLQAQDPWGKLFNHDTIADKRLGKVIIHITNNTPEVKKPLLVYLDGSGNYPLVYRKRNGNYSSTVAFNIGKYAKDYTIVLISKPGIPFTDSLHYDAEGRSYYPDNEEYRRLYSLDWRAGAAAKAINYLVKHIPVDTRHIIVMGHSEGAQVAPRVAVLNKKVTHVVAMSGNGLNQLYDFLINARLDAARQKITAEEGQQVVDSLYTVYERIYANPQSAQMRWYGATYLKWSSFSQTTPLENMLQLNIPILYIGGGKDNNQTIIDMDYVRLEFLKKRKHNLTYKVYPNSDHYFQETVITGSKETKVDRLNEVNQFALDWVKVH